MDFPKQNFKDYTHDLDLGLHFWQCSFFGLEIFILL